MPSISIRNLKEETLNLLRIQATNHGVSMEEEVRRIIVRGVTPPEPLGDLAIKLFGPGYDDKEFELPAREPHTPMVFK